MRLLIVSQYFWPESFRINDVARGLRERGHDVQVLTGMPNYPHGQLFPEYGWFTPARGDFDGIPVVRAPLVTRGRNKSLRLALNYLTFALSASVVGPLRLRGPIDAVLVYEPSPITVGFPGLIMGALKHAPVLLWIQDLWPDTLEAIGVRAGGLAARAGGLISDFIHRRCDLLLAQSRAYEPRLVARGIERARIEYLPNWAEDMFRALEDARAAADPMHDIAGFRIVFAGNIGSAQSFETLVNAATRLREAKDIKWSVLGDGNMRAWLEAEIGRRDLGETVRARLARTAHGAVLLVVAFGCYVHYNQIHYPIALDAAKLAAFAACVVASAGMLVALQAGVSPGSAMAARFALWLGGCIVCAWIVLDRSEISLVVRRMLKRKPI